MDAQKRKLLICLGSGLLAALLLAVLRGLFRADSPVSALLLLCDGFFVAGAVLLGIGGLVWTHAGGVTDGLGFSMKTFWSLKWRAAGDYRESFEEYRKRREARSGSPRPWLISGGILFGTAVILYALWYLIR